MENAMRLRLNANAIVTNKEGKILLIRLNNGPFKGGLCIPGGGVEAGEFGPETVKRELMEETGIEVKGTITPIGFCEMKSDKNHDHKVILIYKAEAEGTPKQKDEHTPAWWDLADAEKELIPFTKEAVRIWKNNERHFSIKFP